MIEPWTNETAKTLPRPRAKGCAGYRPQHYRDGVRKSHDRHNLRRLPFDPGYSADWRKDYAEEAAEWANVTDGRTCNKCFEVYDPAPICEQIVNWNPYYRYNSLCDSPAKHREPGMLNLSAERLLREHVGATEEHNFCGRHAPSRMLAREHARRERERVKAVERKARRAPSNNLNDAREALIAEAVRWRDDEAATGEGFCEDDDACEHHECRLARAVNTLEGAQAAHAADQRARYG